MPGLNRRGPNNQGPMTGGGRGFCTGAIDPAQGSNIGYAPGFSGGQGKRWGRGGFDGRGRMRPWQTAPGTDNDLQARAKWLEGELATVRQQLDSPS